MQEKFSQFDGEKYINLETYKKDGTGVKTPVWFVTHSDFIYIITREMTGKVKRLSNNQSVKITPCGFKGEIKGQWISGNAKAVSGEEAERVIKLRKKKYGFFARAVGIFTSQKGNLKVYSISI
tara:strand:+ start:166 stop:534 length:369 start_codon:yes stop_codon:yes gene_type:complete